MSALMQPLLPEPVVPAMSRWTILTRSATIGLPETSLPSQKASGEACGGNGLVDVAQRHVVGLDIGHLDADGRLAGDRRLHADVRRGEGVGEVVLEACHLADLDARSELKLVARDARARHGADDGAPAMLKWPSVSTRRWDTLRWSAASRPCPRRGAAGAAARGTCQVRRSASAKASAASSPSSSSATASARLICSPSSASTTGSRRGRRTAAAGRRRTGAAAEDLRRVVHAVDEARPRGRRVRRRPGRRRAREAGAKTVAARSGAMTTVRSSAGSMPCAAAPRRRSPRLLRLGFAPRARPVRRPRASAAPRGRATSR